MAFVGHGAASGEWISNSTGRIGAWLIRVLKLEDA